MRNFPILLLILLTACASPAQIAAADDATCQSFGAKPHTEAYVACRMQQQQYRMQENALRRAELADFGRRLSAAAEAGRQHRGNDIDCTSTRSGPFVNTSCSSR